MITAMVILRQFRTLSERVYATVFMLMIWRQSWLRKAWINAQPENNTNKSKKKKKKELQW